MIPHRPDAPIATPARRWQRWWLAWLRRRPPTAQYTLTLHNLYVLPTRPGWMLAAVLVLLLVGSINYQLNLGYGLTFALAGASVVSVWVAHANLAGLTLSLRLPDVAFAGHPTTPEVRLQWAGRRPRWAIALRWHGIDPRPPAWVDLASTERSAVGVPWTPPQRGRLALPPLVIETRYPLGIARVWSVWCPAPSLLVAPAPETSAPPLPRATAASTDATTPNGLASGSGDEARPYRPGDAPRRILWRKAAQHPDEPTQWTVRSGRPPGADGPLWLDEASCGLSDTEAQRARLCAWVLQADAAGLRYGLRVGAVTIAPDHGPAHRLRCLEALACA